MTTPQIAEANILTGETVVRDMTDAELAQFEKDKVDAKANAKANADRAALKTATLAKLGLTADEVAALLS
jgi:hypothetical protein